ncbi:AraC family transcriptional regulator [Paenibacillus sacheonensis]|uniref:Helix-turn-helix domain-containing protein n=1 Tax=Paenibacillus sacheonensis TaxID=742054 RepID=A0A7X4YLF2_9BACL|nr:AraC family transcriptional regulator [Paenibacillus sacheonensis]MBM7568312.1 AraC-like DNA-binding protein [Paenibacillus sacheonensis]NBC68503.1 helix-turn-helix domain-containing protein [Paenibacillus sacheonensis]
MAHDRKRFHFDNLYFLNPKQYELFTLYQIGDLSCDSGYVLQEHTQVCYEITYIMSGKGWFSTNGRRSEVEAGDLYINIPGEVHTGGADDKEPFRYFYMGFLFNLQQDDDYRESYESPFIHIQKMLDKRENPLTKDRLDMQHTFLSALKEFRSMSHYSQMMTQTYLNQLIVLMYRNFFSDWDSTYHYDQGSGGTKEIVYNAISYIDNNMLTMQDLAEVSRVLGYSYSYLSHLFTEETGISLRNFYSQKRLQKMIELMKSQTCSITEIASTMQYQSIHSFSRAFKKAVGLSPTEYIRLYVKE